MKRFFQFVAGHKKMAALTVCVVIAATAATTYFLNRPHPHPESKNPDVLNPVLAVEFLEKLKPESVYYTLSAHDYLASKKPEWVTAHGSPDAIQDFFHAGQDGSFWRTLDHQFHFDAIMLCGDPSEYQPLLNYLITQPDFTPVYLDHAAIIFLRSPATRWTPDSLGPLNQKFAGYPPIDRACFLAMLGAKLDAVGETTRARQYLDESLTLDHDSPYTWTQLAHNDAQKGNIQGALEDTGHALKLDENDYYALTTRVHLLEYLKRYEDALHASESLVKTHKDDSMVLYKHVMIAHEAHAYTEEIATLTHLIDIVSGQKRPVAGFRVYLGQAYALDGQAQPALDEFQKALDEGTLGDQERDAVNLQMSKIKEKVSGTN